MGVRMHSDVTIVLVKPRYGGNLGSTARVMANFGLHDLVLVQPAAGLLEDPALEPMAREGALPILRDLKVVDTLAEALADTEIALGFTTRLGKQRCDGYDLRPAIELLAQDYPASRVAAVFGSEDKGLCNEDLERCHWLLRIPTSSFSSLNLAQAVGTFAYELHTVSRQAAPQPGAGRNVATVAVMEGFYEHMERVFGEVGFLKESSPSRMMNQMRRLFSRRLPTPRDVRILRGVFSKIELALKRARQGLNS